jgi:hypothetical protein
MIVRTLSDPAGTEWIKDPRTAKGTRCERCGLTATKPCQLDIHHRDHDHENNYRANLETICANCHRLHHGTQQEPEPWPIVCWNCGKSVGILITDEHWDMDSDGGYLPRLVCNTCFETMEALRSSLAWRHAS